MDNESKAAFEAWHNEEFGWYNPDDIQWQKRLRTWNASRKQIAALKADKQELETELARTKAKWQEDYLTLNDVCNQQIKLEAAAKLALDALQEACRRSDRLIDRDYEAAIEALRKAGIK